MICSEWVTMHSEQMKETEEKLMSENNKQSFMDIPEDLLDSVTGGNDPETMSQKELEELIHHYRDLANRMKEGSYHNKYNATPSINACNNTADSLQAIYRRRFMED